VSHCLSGFTILYRKRFNFSDVNGKKRYLLFELKANQDRGDLNLTDLCFSVQNSWKVCECWKEFERMRDRLLNPDKCVKKFLSKHQNLKKWEPNRYIRSEYNSKVP